MRRTNLRAAIAWPLAVMLSMLAPSDPAQGGEEDAVQASEHLPATVSRIVFEGNERSQPSILLRELSFAEGDTLTAEDLEWSRQAILDMQLFQDVAAAVEPMDDGTVRAVFKVDEKSYWRVLPRVGRGSGGDVSYGAKARFDNLWGLDHSFETVIRRKEFTDPLRGDEDRLTFDYRAPGWKDTRLDFELVGLTSTLNIENELPGGGSNLFREATHALSFGVARWLGDSRIDHGWRLGGDLSLRRRTSTPIRGPLNRTPEVDHVALGFNLRFQDFHHHVWSDTGETYGYRFEQGLGGLGDDDFTTQEIYYTSIWELGGEHRNMYVDVGMGQSRGGDRAFVVLPRGLPDLRGVLSSVEEGDTYRYLRTGYMHPIFGKDSLRAEIFMDTAEFFFSGLPRESTANVGVGLGIRWRLRSFVQLDIALGFSYLPETGETKFWASTDTIGG